MLVYNVGDSFTCAGDWCPDETMQFWYCLAQDLGANTVENNSEPGRSNDEIIKIIMRHCLENPNLDVTYFVNITTIYRFDITTQGGDKFHDVLKPMAVANLDFEKVECTLYAQLIGLMSFLDQHGKNFLVFNNYRNFSQEPLPMRDSFVSYIQQEPRVLNWFDSARADHNQAQGHRPWDFDTLGWGGHDTAVAHRSYYELLRSRMIKL